MFKSKNSKSDILDGKQKIKSHGKEMWNVLHTFSVYLPEKCTNEEANEFSDFVKGVLHFGTKFNHTWHENTKKYIHENPLNFITRKNSMLWICNFHNHVNRQLEKDLFECTEENIAKRWGNLNKIVQNQNKSFI